MSEEFLEESSKLDLYYAERKLASPIIHLIHDWQQAKEKGQEKPESELKQEILNLLDNGGDVNEPELPLSDYNYGYTPILIASEAGAVEVVQALIERGANVDAILTQSYNCTSLGLAIIYDILELVKILVKNGATLRFRFSHGNNSPLHMACRTNRPEIAEFFIRNNAELNSLQPVFYGNVQYGFSLTPLHMIICYNGTLKIVELLAQYGADLEIQSAGGQTALLLALFENQFEMAKVLIENGANVNFINFNADGQNPLHIAATKDYPGSTKMLIDYGADINTRNIQGDNALQVSLHFQKHENFKLIVFMNHQYI